KKEDIMSCCIEKYDICMLIQEDWISPIATVTDVNDNPIDLTAGYKVEYSLTTMTGQMRTFDLTDNVVIFGANNNKIMVSPISVELRNYQQEMVLIQPDGTTDVLFQGLYEVKNEGCKC